MKKSKLLLLGAPIIPLAPMVAVSCEKPADHKLPTNDEDPNYQDVVKALHKITFNDLNFEEQNPAEWDIKSFYDHFINDTNIPNTKLNLKSNSDFYKSVGGKAEFEKKYEIYFSAAIINELDISFSAWLAPKGNKKDYTFKGKLYKNYFYYERAQFKVSGFSGDKEKRAKKEHDEKVWNIVRISVPTIVAVGVAIFVIIQIIRKKKGLIKNKGAKKYHGWRRNK
ncbi:hypothetical protein [[Mycoplasma] anseris]|uniref:Lipoprotein n=1 Tax=[Mycoplasma] anseris TaxID=92400 RepID=A0A2Z4NCT9_9BACT|nr:hypothetical protein [[Mycoplasma] anseris]AWX69306.1 hypothetical protein DP065_00855 [[Mycoplasma] anseris]